MEKVTVQNPACYRIGGPVEKQGLVHEAYYSEIEIGPEESEIYEYMTSDYIYGAPVLDDLDKCPVDRDGFLVRKRFKIL